LFERGDYQPLAIEGERAEHLLAFAREHAGEVLLVIAPRLSVPLLGDATVPVIPTTAWGDTAIVLPDHLSRHVFHDGLIEQPGYQAPSGRLPVADLLASLPVHIAVAARVSERAVSPSTYQKPTDKLTPYEISTGGKLYDEQL
jgi:(1->4)-alpha-D-glucan 1-alpha-D-glucosylmutase